MNNASKAWVRIRKRVFFISTEKVLLRQSQNTRFFFSFSSNSWRPYWFFYSDNFSPSLLLFCPLLWFCSLISEKNEQCRRKLSVKHNCKDKPGPSPQPEFPNPGCLFARWVTYHSLQSPFFGDCAFCAGICQSLDGLSRFNFEIS